MSENLPVSPRADIADSSLSSPIKLYSPIQVACGTIGGPVGLIYFLRANFLALGNAQAARKTTIIGVLLLLGITVLAQALPQKMPSTPISIAYIIVARVIAEKFQKRKQEIADSPQYGFHSNWRVLLLGLLCLPVSAFALVGLPFLAFALGIWEP